jgi:hypothetical protein
MRNRKVKRIRTKPSAKARAEHFTATCLKMIFATTVLFIISQWISFIITREEQAVMVEWYWKVVGLECGAMMLKAIIKIIVARVEKKEKIKIHHSDEPSYETEE